MQNIACVRQDSNDINIASQALISSLQCACCRDLMVQIDKKCNTFSQRVRVSGGCRIEALGFISVESLLRGVCCTTNGEEVAPFI